LPRLWVDVFDTLSLNLFDGMSDPSALHLDGSRAIRQEGRTTRAVEVERVRISWDGGSQVGHGRFLPFLVERLAVNVAQSRGRHTAFGDIEAGGNADDIEIMVSAIFKLNASFIEGDDGVVLGIDDVDIVAVELLEVSVFQTWALHTPRMGRLQRGEDIAFLGVIHSSALLLGPEVVDFAVGFGCFAQPRDYCRKPPCPQSMDHNSSEHRDPGNVA